MNITVFSDRKENSLVTTKFKPKFGSCLDDLDFNFALTCTE